MTIQDLKNNREQIIAIITEKAGSENVKVVMEQMLKGLSCCDTMEDLIESAIYMALEFEVKVEKSRIAKLHSEAHIDEKYNTITKDFEKI